jgi:hypothetical protein
MVMMFDYVTIALQIMDIDADMLMLTGKDPMAHSLVYAIIDFFQVTQEWGEIEFCYR